MTKNEARLIDGIKFNLKVIKTLVTAIENNDSDVDLDKSMVELQSLTALTQDYAKKLAECRKPLAQKSSVVDFAEVAKRKQASRDEDERALASGEKSREDLRLENSIFAPLGKPKIISLIGKKPLR